MIEKRSSPLELTYDDDGPTLVAKEIIAMVRELYPNHDLHEIIGKVRELLDEHTRQLR